MNNTKPIANGIQMYLHCKGCISQGRKDKVSVGWTVKGIQVWCDTCGTNILALDFKGQKVAVDYDPDNSIKKLETILQSKSNSRQNAIMEYLKEGYFTRNLESEHDKISGELERVLASFDGDIDNVRKATCFVLYYNNNKKIKPTRTSILKAVCELFITADGSLKPTEEVMRLLNEERFREYDAEASEIVKKKFKHLYDAH